MMNFWEALVIAVLVALPLAAALEGLRWAVWRFHEWRCDVYYARHVKPAVDAAWQRELARRARYEERDRRWRAAVIDSARSDVL